MKKAFFLFALCFVFLLSATPIQERKIEPKALSELTALFGISEDSDIVAETQKLWLRKPGQERWEMTEFSAEKKASVLDWAVRQGLFAAWEPAAKNYDKALILGATTGVMQKRLDYLKAIWEQGVRFEEIVWLTGDRPLDPKIDQLTDRATNESEAARVLWNDANLPEEMKALPVVFVAVPMKQEGNQLKRPNTEDTIVAWLQVAPEPCSGLFISSQPFCGYQFAIVKANLPDAYLFDVVGPETNPFSHPSGAAITLDAVARWIYQESLCK